MTPRPERHVLVCTNQRPDGPDAMPSCGANGSTEVLSAFLRERAAAGSMRSIYITQCLCLGVCPERGATVVIYPEGTWYVGVEAQDVAEICREHVVGGRAVDRLVDCRYR
jgi:(2Fe-2S) ferredoxin